MNKIKPIQPIIENKIGKKKSYVYDQYTFDSKEEIYVYWALTSLQKSGVIKKFIVKCQTEQIISQVFYTYQRNKKIIQGKLLESLNYTPDFIIYFNSKYSDIEKYIYKIYNGSKNFMSIGSKKRPAFIVINNQLKSYIDVKGGYSKFGDLKGFSVKQKIIYNRTGIYVQKIIPADLFKRIGVPDRYLYTDSGIRLRKIKPELFKQ